MRREAVLVEHQPRVHPVCEVANQSCQTSVIRSTSGRRVRTIRSSHQRWSWPQASAGASGWPSTVGAGPSRRSGPGRVSDRTAPPRPARQALGLPGTRTEAGAPQQALRLAGPNSPAVDRNRRHRPLIGGRQWKGARRGRSGGRLTETLIGDGEKAKRPCPCQSSPDGKADRDNAGHRRRRHRPRRRAGVQEGGDHAEDCSSARPSPVGWSGARHLRGRRAIGRPLRNGQVGGNGQPDAEVGRVKDPLGADLELEARRCSRATSRTRSRSSRMRSRW